jgi:aspartate aminotransferase-like enzyme
MLNEQTQYLIGHREKEFSDLYGGITDKITKFFQLPAEYKPTVTTGSGTLWFDIVGRSIVQQKALACVNGAFSKRARKPSRHAAKKPTYSKSKWAKLSNPTWSPRNSPAGKYDTLTVCHNETSTGVRSPIAEIGKMVKKEYPDVIFAVDAVSSMAGDKTLPHE